MTAPTHPCRLLLRGENYLRGLIWGIRGDMKSLCSTCAYLMRILGRSRAGLAKISRICFRRSRKHPSDYQQLSAPCSFHPLRWRRNSVTTRCIQCCEHGKSYRVIIQLCKVSVASRTVIRIVKPREKPCAHRHARVHGTRKHTQWQPRCA